MDQTYFKKLENCPKEAKDLIWNIPETEQGIINIIGGNSQSFRTESHISDFCKSAKFPAKSKIITVLPDALQKTLPKNLENFVFLSSTPTGSFKSSEELLKIVNAADSSLLLGDFSKNQITEKAVASAVQSSEKSLFLTRDTIDLISNSNPEPLLKNPNLFLLATLPQIQKLFHAALYPKIITMSMSLLQFADAIHKFTLSYPAAILTFHSGNILVSQDGKIIAVPLEKTSYSPITLWSGELAAKILAINLFNKNQKLNSAICAIFSHPIL